MYKLIRIINQNKKQILIAILAIVFGISFIQILNKMAKDEREEKLNELKNNSFSYNSSTYNPNYSIISGESVSENTQSTVNTLIDNFMNSCNNGQVQTAYGLLSKDCKEQLYPTLEDFKNKYYINNFKTKKEYSIQLWNTKNLTYKVELYEDVLALGKVERDNSIEDFFTIVKEDGQNKLNISGYVGKTEINKSETNKGITITANYKNVYKDYEVYNITIENNTENNILLNSNESTKTIYLKGQKGVKYTAYIYEINRNDIELNSYYKVNTNIKFNKKHTTDDSITSMIFSDIVLNADEYENVENKLEYKDRIEIQLDM